MMNPKCKECLGRVPQRWVLVGMIFLGLIAVYLMRISLNIAITQMVRMPKVDVGNPDDCPYEAGFHPSKNETNKRGDFDWDEATQGLILASFYWGYIFTQLPGGMLAEKFGGKHIFGFGVGASIIFTYLTPGAAHLGAGVLIALRVIMGACQGMIFPATSVLMAQWAPPLERSKMITIIYTGNQVGLIISNAATGLIMAHTRWDSVFYVWGTVSCLYFFIYVLVCYSNPKSHPYISDKERAFLEEVLGGTERKKDLGKTPWKAILTSLSVWALIIRQIGHGWGFFTVVTSLPKYMNDVIHFKISSNGLLSSLPFAGLWAVSITASFISDYMIKKGFNVTVVRKINSTISSFGPAIGLIAASYAGCHKTAVVVLFTFGVCLLGFFYPSIKVTPVEMSPNFAGVLTGLGNGAGAFAGMIAPYIAGLLTPNRRMKEWNIVFWVVFATMIGTNIPFLFFGTGEVQKWNDPQNVDKDEKKKAKD